MDTEITEILFILKIDSIFNIFDKFSMDTTIKTPLFTYSYTYTQQLNFRYMDTKTNIILIYSIFFFYL